MTFINYLEYTLMKSINTLGLLSAMGRLPARNSKEVYSIAKKQIEDFEYV
jgi:hypothetical protein